MTKARKCPKKPTITVNPDDFPDPRTDGITELPPELLADLFATIRAVTDYIAENDAGCAAPTTD